MDLRLDKVIQIYKEELANAKEEAILRRAAQIQLEEEVAELKARLASLENNKEDK